MRTTFSRTVIRNNTHKNRVNNIPGECETEYIGMTCKLLEGLDFGTQGEG